MTAAVDQPAPTRRGPWIGLVVVAVAVALVASAAGIALLPSGAASPLSPTATITPTRTVSPTPPTDAAGPLIAMADLLVAGPPDATYGRYYYTRIEEWSRADDHIVGFLRQEWHTIDGGLIRWQKRLPGQPASSFDMAHIGVPGTFDAVRPTRDTGGADEVQSFIERHGAPSGNPVELARAIDSDNGGQPLTVPCPPACDITIRPIVFFDAITGLYRETYVDRSARAALLRLIAVQPGVMLLGEVTDRAGRKAIAVAVTEGGVRFSLLFDRKTGVLLASERAVPGFVLDDYSLYLALDLRDSTIPTTGAV
jgi:hypothetical protein